MTSLSSFVLSSSFLLSRPSPVWLSHLPRMMLSPRGKERYGSPPLFRPRRIDVAGKEGRGECGVILSVHRTLAVCRLSFFVYCSHHRYLGEPVPVHRYLYRYLWNNFKFNFA